MNKSKRLALGLLAFVVCGIVIAAGIGNVDRAVADDGERIDQYTTKFIDKNNNVVYRIETPGIPPPEVIAQDAVALPEDIPAAGIGSLTDVPAYYWVYGCGPTVAGMLAGYYDQPGRGYTNIYAGPTNGGVAPLNNETYWPNVSYGNVCGQGTVTCGSAPYIASKNGLDGRATRGHVDDYWSGSNCSGDPYTTSEGWPAHADDCVADYVGSSIWTKNGNAWNHLDGSTWTWYSGGNLPLYDYSSLEPGNRDFSHGLRLFFESRGYTVNSNYSQFISGYGGSPAGFTFAQFKDEIDAGRPVILHLTNHYVLGVGYDDTGNTVYIHNTWDHSTHAMAWGGTYTTPFYSGTHYGVIVLHLAPILATPSVTNAAGATSVTTTTAILNGNLASSGGADTTIVIYGGTTDGGMTPTNWQHSDNLGILAPGDFSLGVTGLAPNTTYYYRCAATNSAGTSWAPSSSSFVTPSVWAAYWSGPGKDWFRFSSGIP